MVGEPSHVKQLSLNHLCKIGLRKGRKSVKLGSLLMKTKAEMSGCIMVLYE